MGRLLGELQWARIPKISEGLITARWVATPALDFLAGRYKMKLCCIFLRDVFHN